MAVKRFQRQQGYTPQPTQTGRGDVAALLADRLARFSNIGLEVVEQQAAISGAEAGAQAGGVAAPQKQSDFTIRGRAFNQAAMKAHAAAVDADIRMKIADFEAAHPSDPDAFDARLEGFKKGLMEGVDPNIRQAVEQEFSLQGQRARLNIADRKRALVAEQTIADLNAGVEGASNGALAASRAGDVAMAEHERGKASDLILAQVRSPENPFGVLSAEQARSALAKLDADMDAETVLGGFQKTLGDRPTPATISAAREKLDAFRASDAATLGLAPDQKERLTARLEGALVDGMQSYQRRTDLEVGENAMVRGRAYGDLYRKVQDGTASVVSVEDAYQSGLINAPTRGSWLAQLDEAAKKSRAKAAALGKVQATLEGEAWLDPKDKDDKAAVDAYYAQMVDGTDPLSPEMLTRTVELSELTGIIPETVRSFTRSFQRSPDPNRVIAAAEMVGRLEERAGQAIEDIPKDDRAFASLVNSYTASGTDHATAIQMARQTVYETSPDVRESWDKEFNKPKVSASLTQRLTDKVDSEYGGFFAVDPAVPEEMAAEYQSLSRGYYTLTRDLDTAQSLAFNDLKRVWGPTDIGGPKRMMKYAPESIYGTWAGDQFKADMAAAGIAKPFIVADERTAREQRPSYAIFKVNEDGLPEPIIGKRWRPDATVMRAAEEAKRKAEGMSEAERILKERDEAQRKFELLKVK